MTQGERILIFGCGMLAVVLLMCTAVATGGMLLVGSGGRALLENIEGALPVVQEPVRFEAPKADPAAGTTGASGEVARPLSREREAALQQARQAREAPGQLRALPLPAPARGEAGDLTSLFEQVNPGVVSIEVVRMLGGAIATGGQGSGFLVDDQHVVTNNHVVGDIDEVDIIFDDGRRRKGTVVGKDVFSDLAVVRVEDVPSGARPLPLLVDFDQLRVGEPVVAIGNPFGFANTMTSGIISALGRTIPDGATQFQIPQTIQTDAAINPGNSGGPLLNARGQVIGVNAQIRTQGTAANAGIGFAIPASIVSRVVPELIAKGSYDWPYLGVSGGPVNSEIAEARGLDIDTRGAYIHEIVTGGPSGNRLQGTSVNAGAVPQQQGELVADGDIVIAINDEPVFSFDDLLTYISLETKPGQTVEITVLRGEERVVVPVTLSERPREGRVR